MAEETPTSPPEDEAPQNAEPPKEAKRRSILWIPFWLVVGLGSLLISLGYHLSLTETRSFARVLIEDLASDALSGSLEIGRVDELGVGRAHFSDVVLRDPQGRVVIHAQTVTAWPDLWRLYEDGTIRIAGGHVEDAEVILYVEGEDGLEVSLVQAFQPASPGPPGGDTTHILIEGLEVSRALVHGDAPRYPGVRVEDTHVLGRIDIEEEVLLQVFSGTGRMTGPYPGETSIDAMVVSFTTDRALGLDAYGEASRGPTRARARARVTWPDGEDTPPLIVVTASAEPVCMGTLAEMGFPGLDRLEGCANGHLRLEGHPASLALTSSLDVEAGHLDITGVLPDDGRYSFEATTRGLELARLVPAAPELRFSGRAHLELDPDETTAERARFDLEADPLAVEGYEVPAFSARGVIEAERIIIEELNSPHLSGSIAGRGVVGFDGSMDIHVDVDVTDAGLDPNIARLAPGVHGPTRGGLDIVTTAGSEWIDVRWDLVFAPFRYGPVRAARLATRGRAYGFRDALRVEAQATGDGTTVRGLHFGHVAATLRGGPSEYGITLETRGGRDIPEARSILRLRRTGGGFDIETSDYAANLGFGLLSDRAHPLDGTSPQDVPPAVIRVRGNRFELENIELRDHASRISVRGTVDTARDGTDLHAELEGFDVALVRPFLPERFARAAGTAHATLDLAGSLSDPDVALSGGIAEATIDGQRTLALTFRFDYSTGRLYAHIDGDIGDTGRLRVDGPIEVAWSALTDPDRVLDEARFDGLEIDMDRINVAFVTPFLGESARALGATGKVTVALRLLGGMHDLEVPWAVLILDRFALPNTTPVRAKLEGALAANVLTLRQVWVADAAGELALGSAVMTLPLDAPPEAAADWLPAIAEEPWQVRLDIAERRLDGWPRPLSKYLPRGVLFGGFIELVGDENGVTAHLESALRWDEAATRAACAADLRPVLEIDADTANGITTGRITALIDDVVVGTGTTTSRTPISDWLSAGVRPTTPSTLVDLRLDGLSLERVPWTCDTLSGDVRGDVRGTLFDPSPALVSAFDVTGLRVRSAPDAPPSGAYHAAVRVTSEGTGLNAVETCIVLGHEDGARTPLSACPSARSLRSAPAGAIAEDGELIAVGEIPVRFSEGASLPAVAWTEDMFAMLDAQAAELEPLLVWIPGVAQANAIADGTVRAEGAWETLTLEGGLAVHDGEARVISMGQYLHDVGGPLRFVGNRIVLPEDRPWEAWDGERLLRFSGEIGMRGLLPIWVDLDAMPTAFPFRREGAVLAELSGDAHLYASIGEEGVEGRVTTGDLTIQLPQASVGAVQDLALSQDILVIGEDAPDLARITHLRFPYHIVVDASRPFTVRRNDFEVEVTAQLDVTYSDPDLFIGGVAEIRRGTFEILGKRFAVTRGSLSFDGGPILDPAVDLVATYALPGRSGSTISVIASGSLLDIGVDFQSTESSDTGEILALLVSGRASRATDPTAAQQAGEQAANFISGLLAGVLTLGLREQFGSVVPNISLETGGRGNVSARVGFDADWIIPDFLREVVLGAYFEGTFGSDGRNSLGGGVGLGVTLELQFPFNFVGSGSYLTPANGGLDLVWDAF